MCCCQPGGGVVHAVRKRSAIRWCLLPLFQELESKARNMFRSPMTIDGISEISMYPVGNVACCGHGVLATVDLALAHLAQNVPDDTLVRCQSERGGWFRGGLTSNTQSLLCIIRQGAGASHMIESWDVPGSSSCSHDMHN